MIIDSLNNVVKELISDRVYTPGFLYQFDTDGVGLSMRCGEYVIHVIFTSEFFIQKNISYILENIDIAANKLILKGYWEVTTYPMHEDHGNGD